MRAPTSVADSSLQHVLFDRYGKVALRLAPLLIARQDEVTSVFRNTDHEADVAATVTATLADDATIGRTICFRNGGTPIADALRAIG